MSGSRANGLLEALETLDLKKKEVPPPILKPDDAFKKEIEESSFWIFKCMADLGYYGWHPEGPYKSLADVTASEIKQHIDLHMKPPKVECTNAINKRLPKNYASLSPQKYKNKYPHNSSYITSLHVAIKYKGVKIEEVDFLLGFSTLELFANKCIPSGERYVAMLIPLTKIITIFPIDADYMKDYSDPGFQFRRFVTGKKFEDDHDPSIVKHLQLMGVSRYCVLFATEADARDEYGSPVKITQSNPKYWGRKMMAKMISSGSKTLYSGFKSRGQLISVKKISLGLVIQKALGNQDCDDLEDNISECMEKLKEAMNVQKLKEGCALEIFFEGNELSFKVLAGSVHGLLLPKKVIEELIF